jgi:phosphoenolpyruvate carboxykinase (GTP)
MLERVDGQIAAVDSPIGLLPKDADIRVEDLGVDLAALFAVDPEAWQREADDVDAFFTELGDRVPEAMHRQLGVLRERLSAASTA